VLATVSLITADDGDEVVAFTGSLAIAMPGSTATGNAATGSSIARRPRNTATKLPRTGRERTPERNGAPPRKRGPSSRGKRDGLHDQNGRPLPDGGCIGEADHELDGGSRADVLLPEKLANTAYERSLVSAPVEKEFSAWSSCMREKGYTSSDPVSATNDCRRAGRPGPPARRSIAPVGNARIPWASGWVVKQLFRRNSQR
jgi:hypothetical protein